MGRGGLLPVGGPAQEQLKEVRVHEIVEQREQKLRRSTAKRAAVLRGSTADRDPSN